MKYHYRLPIIFCLCTIVLLPGFGQAGEKAQPVFENGEAQIVPAFENRDDWIRHDLWVETEFDTDGDQKPDRMHVAVTRPKQTDTEGLKLPVVYETSPYFAGTAGFPDGMFWDVKHELGEMAGDRVHPEVTRGGKRPIISNSQIKAWVPRGYIVVHSSSPGTGLSQGSPTVGGDNESLAPKAVIDWLCGRAKGYTTPDGEETVTAYWCTGKVGMTGTSYNGTLPLAAATTGVEGLEAIIPIAPNTSYYHYYRSNGLVRSPGGYLGEDIDVLYDFIHSGDESKRAYSNATVRDKEMKEGMDRITGDLNEFWEGRDYLNDMGPMKAALLMSHGLNDWNVMPEHSYRIYTNHRLIYLTPELAEDLHISGLAEITIRVAANKPAVNLSVWLVSLPWQEGRRPKITDNIITRGWADPQNHSSLSESEALVPGEFYTLTFKLQPDDQIIPKGQKIGLMIFSSDREFTLWPEPGTELTVNLDATSISLPVVGGEASIISVFPE